MPGVEPVERVVASIRPRLLCRGNRDRPDDGVSESEASIRPRLLCRGNAAKNATSARVRIASIRPRLLCRGNTAWGNPTWRLGECFNSAAAVMPRKHRGRTLQVDKSIVASIRPRLLCRGNPNHHNDRSPTSQNASIRPRLLCRGNPTYWTDSLPSPSRFNSAAAVMPRKPSGAS